MIKLNVKRSAFFALTALLIILFGSFVYAFDVESGSATSVCAGTTIVASDIVKGTGSFTVVTSGTAKPFSTTVPTGFSLDNGAQYLYSYITPSSRTTPGTYDLIIKITSGQEEKNVIHSVTVEDCHASDLAITPQVLETCPCSPVIYTALLRNTGQYMESYQLSVEGPIKDRITLSDSVLNINSNENKTFTVYVNTSCNSGKYDFTVKAKATTSMTINEAKSTLDIKPCYEYSIYLPQNYYSICEHASLDIPLTVYNEGTSRNKILLNFKGPLWSSLTKNQVEINPDAREPVNITVNPNFNDLGNFTILIDAMSEKGFVKKSTEAKINVEKCYGVSLSIAKDKDKLCNGISNTYDVAIKNNGKFRNTYNLEIKGPEWASIANNTLTLDADEEKIISINADPSNTATAGTFEISLKAVDPISNEQSKDSIELTTTTVEDCYKAIISAKDDMISVAPDSFATDLLTIQNGGLKNASYIIDISGTAAKYAQINPGIVNLEAGKAETIYLYVSPPADTPESVYELTIATRLKDTTILSSKKISVNVSKLAVAQAEEIENITEQENVTNPGFFVDLGNWFSGIFDSIGSFFSSLFTIKAPEVNETVEANVTEAVSNETLPVSNETITNETIVNVTISNETTVLNETNQTVSNQIEIIGIIEVGNMTGNETLNETASNETLANITNGTLTNETSVIIETNVTQTGNETVTNETVAGNETITAGNETSANEPAESPFKSFLIENRSYIIGAIVIIFLVILFGTGLWKKIIDFFEEEDIESKK